MLPAIYMHLQGRDQAPAVGSSHLWGYPDMPPSVSIPTVEEEDGAYALSLVCQINLADLPQPSGLPERGLLLFFADIAYYGGDWDEPAIGMHVSDNRVVRVVYVPADQLPQVESRRPEYAEQDELPAERLAFDRKPCTLEEPDLQLFGTTDRLEWETWPEPCQGWQLLMMLDSIEGPDYQYNFVDWGCVCFLIDPQALARLDFTDVRALILST